MKRTWFFMFISIGGIVGSVNKVILAGRLEVDPIIFKDGCKFTIETKETVKHGIDGKLFIDTDCHEIVVSGRPSEYALKKLRKGDLVGVEGKIKTHCEINSNNQMTKSIAIVASRIRSLLPG